MARMAYTRSARLVAVATVATAEVAGKQLGIDARYGGASISSCGMHCGDLGTCISLYELRGLSW